MHGFWDIRLVNIPWPWNPGWGSLKVVDNYPIQSGTHEFLLTFHSNHRPISHRFRDKRRWMSKIVLRFKPDVSVAFDKSVLSTSSCTFQKYVAIMYNSLILDRYCLCCSLVISSRYLALVVVYMQAVRRRCQGVYHLSCKRWPQRFIWQVKIGWEAVQWAVFFLFLNLNITTATV